MKKLVSLILAIMMIAAVGAAFADGEATLTGGEVGGTTFPKDSPDTQSKTVIIKKQLTAYNLDEATIHAPTVTYTYAITAGASNVNITDEATDHADGVGAVTAPTKAGVGINNITITGTSANTIAWTTADTLNASTDGEANYKDLKIDFSAVTFGAPGVYRYVLTETPPTSYAATGVTETKAGDAAGSHIRYLDVYVRAVTSGFNTTTDSPSNWDIYGYVCMYDSEAITPDGDTTTTGAMKTNGFVSGTNDGTTIQADSYYTYNLTISKTVENDAYAASTHKFPFTVIFTNSDITGNILLDTTITGTATDFTHAAGAPTWSGHADLLSGSSIKYYGIPMGTDVEVYETNDMTGVTYKVTTTRTNATTATATENAITSGTTITTATQDNPKPAYQSTKTVIDTTKDADDDNTHSVAITNTLLNISPTGYVSRFAPYALILVGGIALLIIAKKHKKHTDEE